jgi:hypothetical protein
MAKKPLTEREKLRVKVLKDARKQVLLGVYKPNCGIVVDTEKLGDILDVPQVTKDPDSDFSYTVREFEKPTELKPLLVKARKDGKLNNCTVCARGSLLLSVVALDNKFKVCTLDSIDNGSFEDDSATDRRLARIFTKKQIQLMECAFEENIFRYDDYGDEAFEKAKDFGGNYSSAKNRLIAILDNAIANRGTFKP